MYFRNHYYDPELGRFISTDPLGYVDSPSMYQFAGYSPTNFGDPLGMYVTNCSKNDQACLKNAERFEAARQANLGRGSEIAATAKAFGNPGEDNGITVSFGTAPPGASANVLPKINFDQEAGFTLSVEVTIDPSLQGTKLEAVVGHEGQHIFDAQAFVATLTDSGYFELSKNLTIEQLETRAYRITNAILRTSNTPMSFPGARRPIELGRLASAAESREGDRDDRQWPSLCQQAADSAVSWL